ncbi:hypothetical protein X985_5589 [Burkholderia pseudomallei MSHR4012]|uniref:hypothetical protein n=1 Tax=Burkholderia pseudomallei TaxID=28450 RepID=UPI000536CBF8|nr:hypothetical protein [Burkholderia pseudomallei]APY96925.1 hypothetical protein BGI50_29270 [Burkholderia pseudomallei]KGV37504.1 hypothetical protein X985_5589 [Burkholderia pseudomallei MSHR4012]KGV53120.1 hypothetical protein X898_5062 [Burkholderia pseudomallei ABCPW 91]KGV54796.1 hypothetical protein X983_3408 [Burkholderia pseudomallei MSHR4003]OMO10375.1 hypothetical protein BGI48_29420 [Burkholderia pseudomallei]
MNALAGKARGLSLSIANAHIAAAHVEKMPEANTHAAAAHVADAHDTNAFSNARPPRMLTVSIRLERTRAYSNPPDEHAPPTLEQQASLATRPAANKPSRSCAFPMHRRNGIPAAIGNAGCAGRAAIRAFGVRLRTAQRPLELHRTTPNAFPMRA